MSSDLVKWGRSDPREAGTSGGLADTPGGADVTKANRQDGQSLAERFWEQVTKSEGCWLWTGPLDRKGYGRIKVGRRVVGTHRYAYQLLVGPIPEGFELDHVKDNGCTSTACVKAIADEFGPAHLEPVTHRENILRGNSPSAVSFRTNRCQRGHEFTPENTLTRSNGKRACRACRETWDQAHRAKRRERRRKAAALKKAMNEPLSPADAAEVLDIIAMGETGERFHALRMGAAALRKPGRRTAHAARVVAFLTTDPTTGEKTNWHPSDVTIATSLDGEGDDR